MKCTDNYKFNIKKNSRKKTTWNKKNLNKLTKLPGPGEIASVA
jgi:hypothetical protein